MSQISTSGISPIPFVNSVAGSAGAQKAALAGTEKSIASEAAAELVLSDLTARTLGDIGGLDEGGDRDADGRMAWSAPDEQSDQPPAEEQPLHDPPTEAAAGDVPGNNAQQNRDEDPPRWKLDFLA